MIKRTAPTPERSTDGPSIRNPIKSVMSDDQRREELKRLLPMWPSELEDLSLAGRRRIVRYLERALRAERRRGRAGYFAYNISRHSALIANHKRERAALISFQIALSNSAKLRAQKSPPKSEPL